MARRFWFAVVGAAVTVVAVFVIIFAIVWLWVFGRLLGWLGCMALGALELLAEPYIGLVDDLAARWADIRRRFEERWGLGTLPKVTPTLFHNLSFSSLLRSPPPPVCWEEGLGNPKLPSCLFMS
ncbi:hypothetical protein GGS24DRAFT_507740 [Hypoxylon argillaceum]|nr:hypothetical protein GGS24DRAFT_507740 [Hypoxylon argillaceum]